MSVRSRGSLLPPLPRVDGQPRRAVTSVNLRFEEKAVFDAVHAWWVLREGQAFSQPDAFSRLLALALENPRAQVPPELQRAP